MDLYWGFASDTVSANRLRKNAVQHLILGGAALERCGNWIIFNTSFSR
jgi:hypothetical protein